MSAFGTKTDSIQKVTSTSFLGKGTMINGKFEIEGSVRIDGKVKGEIEGGADLVIGDSAHIEASIKVKNLTVMGEIYGNVFCEDKLEIHNTGKLVGEITAKRLIIEENAIFEGQSHMKKEEKIIPTIPPVTQADQKKTDLKK
jgi:cytoskeletal protein CcmA (bactofilin family)